MKLITIALTLIATLLASQSWGWYIRCENRSCTASMGGVSVFWDQRGGLYSGVLTGVRGLPLAIDDFERQEKAVSLSLEKSSVIKKSASQKVSVPQEVPGAGTGVDTAKERVFSRRQSLSQTRSAGQGIRIDQTLGFVKWLGDNFDFDLPEGDIRRYFGACEFIMTAYQAGKLDLVIEKFILSKDPDLVLTTPVILSEEKLKKLSDFERSLFLAKYVSVLTFVEDKQKRVNRALVTTAELEVNESELQRAERVILSHLQSAVEMIRPISVLELYQEGKEQKWKETAAFFKWLAETKPDYLPWLPLEDRYVAYSSLRFSEKFRPFKMMPEFQQAIADKDITVTRVVHKRNILTTATTTISEKISKKPVLGLVVIPMIAIPAGVAVYLLKRKRSKVTN